MPLFHHGHAKRAGVKASRTYNSWATMRARCNNPKATSYPRYGALGIKCCARWAKFVNFLADMGERPYGMQLDRKNSKGDYTQKNCRWVTPTVNNNNRSNTIHIAYKGKVMPLQDACRFAGYDPRWIDQVIRKGHKTLPKCFKVAI